MICPKCGSTYIIERDDKTLFCKNCKKEICPLSNELDFHPDIRILVKNDECEYPNTIMRGIENDYCIRYYIKNEINDQRIKYPKILSVIGLLFSIFWLYIFFNPFIIDFIPLYLFVIIISSIMIVAIISGLRKGIIINNGIEINYKVGFNTSRFMNTILWICGILLSIELPLLIVISILYQFVFVFITWDIWLFLNISIILLGFLKNITDIFDSRIIGFEEVK